MRRILLLGANGQLGWEMQRSLAPLGQVVALDRWGATRSSGRHEGLPAERALCGDLSRPVELDATVRLLTPHVIVNAAAYTAVDKAESEQNEAYAVNAEAPGVLAAASLQLGALLVHFSTDYVFAGTGSMPWREDDATGPLNVYGRTKLEGEERIRASGCRHLILRTSWLYAGRGNNFARTMLRLADERESLQVIDDQIGAPTGADLVADTTAHAIRAVEKHPELAGTYHLAARGETSWFGYAKLVIETARARGRSFRLPAEGLRPVPTSAYPTAARRPANSRLDTGRLEAAFELSMPPWQSGVERLLEQLQPA